MEGQPTTFTFSGGTDPLPSGCTAAGTPDCQVSGVDHFIYAVGREPTAFDSLSVPAEPDGSASVTLSFNWGGHDLFVSTVDAAGNISQLSTMHTFMVPWRLDTAATLSAPATPQRATCVALNGQLSLGPYNQGEVVHVVRTDTRHPSGVALPDVPVSTDGPFRINDTPQIGGANTYTVSYPGDGTHFSATATATVQVSRSATALALSTTASIYDYGSTATVTAHLGATYDSRTVSLYAQPLGGGAKVLVKTGTVDSHGNLTAPYKLTGNTAFTASFAGDAYFAPAAATRTAYARVAMSKSLTDYYATTAAGSVRYRDFHHSAKASLGIRITPAKPGECVKFVVEHYYSGSWHVTTTTGCQTIGSNSAFTLTFSLSRLGADLLE
jgi:hypothetical protein